MGSENEAVERLREYLRIPSVHPDIDYWECVKFFKKQAAELDLPIAVYELAPNKPVVVITLKGFTPDLPAILLNSHMDVVPVYEEHWTHPPFAATLTDDGWIYARGVQDMKSIGMMHLEAVRRISRRHQLKRTVHISFVPDEEIGGEEGMKLFSQSKEFKDLNVGFALDESIPSPTDDLLIYNGERTSRAVKITCTGTPGHGSLLSSDTPGEKLHYIIDKFMKLRAAEKKKLDAGADIGDVISINLTMVEGGVQVNVIPESLSVSFDMRIPPDVDHDQIENMITSWCKEAGEGVSFQYYVKNPHVNSTKTDGSVPYLTALQKALEDLNIQSTSYVCPGATDARFVRIQGVPAAGFSPLQRTPLLLHAHDERIHVRTYLRGVDIMEAVLESVAIV